MLTTREDSPRRVELEAYLVRIEVSVQPPEGNPTLLEYSTCPIDRRVPGIGND